MKLASYVPAGRCDSYMFPVREHYFSASEGLFFYQSNRQHRAFTNSHIGT